MLCSAYMMAFDRHTIKVYLLTYLYVQMAQRADGGVWLPNNTLVMHEKPQLYYV